MKGAWTEGEGGPLNCCDSAMRSPQKVVVL